MKMKTKHPLYITWTQMLGRCRNPNNPAFKYYGGRGITVCDRWQTSFAAFVEDMGERPEGHTLDRIDNNGHYEPGNCRWATRAEQMLNLRNVRTITVDGIVHVVATLSRASGLKRETIVERAKKYKTLEEILAPERKIFWEGLAMSPNHGKTHCIHGHAYTRENTYWTPAGYRQCRACKKGMDYKRRG